MRRAASGPAVAPVAAELDHVTFAERRGLARFQDDCQLVVPYHLGEAGLWVGGATVPACTWEGSAIANAHVPHPRLTGLQALGNCEFTPKIPGSGGRITARARAVARRAATFVHSGVMRSACAWWEWRP